MVTRAAERLQTEDEQAMSAGVARRPVVHVTQVLGGIETYLRLFLKYREPSRREVAFVLPDDCDLAREAQARGFRVFYIPMVRELSPLQDLRAARALLRVLRQFRAPILHLHSSKAGGLGRLVAHLSSDVTVLYTPNAFAFLGAGGPKGWMYQAIERLLRRATHVLVAASHSEARRAVTDVGFAPSKVEVVPNSVECDVEPAQPTAGTHRVVMVGRICWQKNIPMFLRVAHAVRAVRSDIEFVLVGTGFYAEDQAELARTFEIVGVGADTVTVVPWMPRAALLELLRTTRVAVLTSRYESFGYVLAEAAVRGVPTVGTRVDGICEVIRDGETGILVDVDDVAAMADAIVRIVDRRQLWEQFSIAGRNHILECFDMAKNSCRLEDLYRRCDLLL